MASVAQRSISTSTTSFLHPFGSSMAAIGWLRRRAWSPAGKEFRRRKPKPARPVEIGALRAKSHRRHPVFEVALDRGKHVFAELVRVGFERMGREFTERTVGAGGAWITGATPSVSRIKGKSG